MELTGASAARRRPTVGIGPCAFGFGGVASLISEAARSFRHVDDFRVWIGMGMTKAVAVFAAFG